MKKILCMLAMASTLASCSDKKETIITKVENQQSKEDENTSLYEFTTNNRIDYFKTKHLLLKNLLNNTNLSNFKENLEYSYIEKDYIEENTYITYNEKQEVIENTCKVSYDYEFHVFQNTNKSKTYTIDKTSNTKLLAGNKECQNLINRDGIIINEYITMKKERIIPALNELFENREKLVISDENHFKTDIDSKIIFTGNNRHLKALDENGKLVKSHTLNESAFDIDNLLSKLSITEYRENLNISHLLSEKLTEACRYNYEYIGIFAGAYKHAINETKRNCAYYESDKGITVQEFLDEKVQN